MEIDYEIFEEKIDTMLPVLFERTKKIVDGLEDYLRFEWQKLYDFDNWAYREYCVCSVNEFLQKKWVREEIMETAIELLEKKDGMTLGDQVRILFGLLKAIEEKKLGKKIEERELLQKLGNVY